MAKFSFVQENQGEQTTFHFSGQIDEDSVFPEVGKATSIHVNFGGVKSINSMGIQGWVLWCKKYVGPNIVFSVSDCPPPVVDQMNFISNFFPTHTLVKSFQVPYACPGCGKFKTLVFHNGVEFTQKKGMGQKNLMVPEIRCSCGETMEVEAIESTYFRFLNVL